MSVYFSLFARFNIGLLCKRRINEVKHGFFGSDIDNEILLSVTLNLVKPIPSLFSGKYFIEMKEYDSTSRAPP
jgi:hypothetical protein